MKSEVVNMSHYTREEQESLINKFYGWNNLKEIDNQYEDICFSAIEQNPYALQYVKKQTENICLAAVKQNGLTLEYVKNQTPKICLVAVKQNGLALKYVKEQTAEICLEAVKKYGIALKYVKEQTHEICLEAIKRNSQAVKYVKEQTEDICLESVKKNGYAITNCKNYTPKICAYALLENYNLIEYDYIAKGVTDFLKNTPTLQNKIFCLDKKIYSYLNNINLNNYELINIDLRSFEKFKNLFLNSSDNNYYIINTEHNLIDNDILKKIAISNNKLLVFKDNNTEVNPIYNTLANKILTTEELLRESF